MGQTFHGSKALVNHNTQMDSVQPYYDSDRIFEPLITRDMERLSEKLGTKMLGLEYSVKTASSIRDKIEREAAHDKEAVKTPRDPSAIYRSMKDIIRYTEICAHNDIFTKAAETIASLTEQGYYQSGQKNYYAEPYPSTGYKGLHLNFISPYGQEFELQIHSKESFEAKQHGHELYEKIRAVSTPVEDKERFQQEIFEIHGSIADPPGYESMQNFTLSDRMAVKEILGEEYTPVITRSDDDKCLSFEIYNNAGEKIFEGYEITFSDGSVQVYHHNPEIGAQTYSFDHTGELVGSHDGIVKDISIEHLDDMRAHIESEHGEWMAEHFPYFEERSSIIGLDEIVANQELRDMEDIVPEPEHDQSIDI